MYHFISRGSSSRTACLLSVKKGVRTTRKHKTVDCSVCLKTIEKYPLLYGEE